ncbi:MAG TPA: ectonucleotide pyrophosphatase/phosphodiesterase [Allosphingosinicella sp.]|nr:ectonucleotide pyrophosphatase/phosphodiesterase [Allosphingosinicella sp.]
MLRNLLLSLLLALGGCASLSAPPPPAAVAETREPVTILVSIDGFHPDYLRRGITPNLNALAEAGVAAPMQPSFPTKTFPNHYTLVTGLPPDRHGIVDNNMIDPQRPDVRFSLGNATQALDPFWWNGAEPIWVTAEKRGIRTATMFWPGSEVAIGGTRPSTWQRFDMNIANAQRVESVIDWLRRPEARRPGFVTLYFDTVDTAGHEHGPDAPETNAAIAEVDERIGDLVRELATLRQPANIIVVSDHGMAQNSPERVIRVDRLVDPAALNVVTDGAYLAFNAQPGRKEEAEKLLRPHEHMQCWRKGELPSRFHYGRHPRVPDYFCLAESGWLVFAKEPQWPATGGTHGYDNLDPTMQALFLASGPDIGTGARLPPFANTEVYWLLLRLLALDPAPGYAGAGVLAPVLKPPAD